MRSKNTGYMEVVLYKDTKPKYWLVHRLVAINFIDNPNNLNIVNHKDENKKNNCVTNLEWVTQNDNCNYGTAIKRRVENTNFEQRNTKEWKENLRQKKNKKVKQFDINMNFLKLWNSAKEASEQLGITRSSISNCCRNKQNRVGNYIFKFEKEGGI